MIYYQYIIRNINTLLILSFTQVITDKHQRYLIFFQTATLTYLVAKFREVTSHEYFNTILILVLFYSGPRPKHWAASLPALYISQQAIILRLGLASLKAQRPKHVRNKQLIFDTNILIRICNCLFCACGLFIYNIESLQVNVST